MQPHQMFQPTALYTTRLTATQTQTVQHSSDRHINLPGYARVARDNALNDASDVENGCRVMQACPQLWIVRQCLLRQHGHLSATIARSWGAGRYLA